MNQSQRAELNRGKASKIIKSALPLDKIPRSVLAAGIWLLCLGGFFLLGAVIVWGETRSNWCGQKSCPTGASLAQFAIAFGLLFGVAGWQVLRAKSWARMGVWLATGLVLVGTFLQFWAGAAGAVELGVMIVPAGLLVLPTARRWFSQKRDERNKS